MSRMVVWPNSRGCTRTPRTIFTPGGGPRGPSSAASGPLRRPSFSSRPSVTVGSCGGTPPRLLDWIRALGPANICVGPGGPDAEATAILGALLDLADQLPDTEAFRQRVRARNPDRRDREGWVWAALEMENHAACAKVAEDLRPFDLPYTADILAARSYGDTRGGWAQGLMNLPIFGPLRYTQHGPFLN